MALTGRTAQLGFFGIDACIDVVRDILTSSSSGNVVNAIELPLLKTPTRFVST